MPAVKHAIRQKARGENERRERVKEEGAREKKRRAEVEGERARGNGE